MPLPLPLATLHQTVLKIEIYVRNIGGKSKQTDWKNVRDYQKHTHVSAIQLPIAINGIRSNNKINSINKLRSEGSGEVEQVIDNDAGVVNNIDVSVAVHAVDSPTIAVDNSTIAVAVSVSVDGGSIGGRRSSIGALYKSNLCFTETSRNLKKQNVSNWDF